MIVIFENEAGIAQYYEEHRLVQVIWKKVKTITFQDYQDLFNACTNLMAQKKDILLTIYPISVSKASYLLNIENGFKMWLSPVLLRVV